MHPNSDMPSLKAAGGADSVPASPNGATRNDDRTPPAVPGIPQSRDDAYRQLATIAEYLARYEPHSPVPYLIQRALEWGSKPLPLLLRELTSGDVDGQRLLTFLGLLPGEGDRK